MSETINYGPRPALSPLRSATRAAAPFAVGYAAAENPVTEKVMVILGYYLSGLPDPIEPAVLGLLQLAIGLAITMGLSWYGARSRDTRHAIAQNGGGSEPAT